MADSRQSFKFNFAAQRVDQVYSIRKDPKDVVGRGNFGVVVKAEDKITSQVRAVKIINKAKFKDRKQETDLLANEFNILMKVDHPNIVRLYEVYEDERYIYFVMEYLRGKTLFQLLNSADYALTEREIRDVFFQLLKGVQYLHKNGIAHRDLKPENIMFVGPKGNQLKIIDFGVSKYFVSKERPEQLISMRTKTGSLYYISPEIFEGKYDCKCDIWSAGVILFALFTCIPPFWDPNPDNVVKKILKISYDFSEEVWQDVSPLAIDLIRRLLTTTDHRLSADEVLAHPWMKVELSGKPAARQPSAIKKFFLTKALSRFVMQIITMWSSETDNQALGEMFIRIDHDGDGVISRETLLEGIQSHFKIYDRELTDLVMSKFAADQKINYQTFLGAVNALTNYPDFDKRVEKAFSIIDVNGKGRVGPEELEAAFKRMNLGMPPEFKSWADMVTEADAAKKGYLDLADFKSMMSFFVAP